MVIRLICSAMMLGMLLITALVVLVVQFALEGQPIAGNAVQISGISVVTVGCVCLALITPFIAIQISKLITQNDIKEMASDGQPAPEKMLETYNKGKLIEFAILESAGIFNAVCYHLTSDIGMIVAVVWLAACMFARYPSPMAFRRWYDRATDEIARLRRV